jgi:agmatinase
VDIESIVNRAFKDGKKVLMMGGEHTYTYFMVKAVRPSSIIIFDAHLDLKESYMGAKLTHATFLRRLLDEDVVKNAYMIGARAYDEDEWIYAHESDKVRIVSSIDELDEVDEPIYISIDLDVYDPSIMKTVTTPEFGGLTPEDLFTYLGKLGERNDVIAGDVMEFSPYTLDPSSLTLATKTVYEALATLYV